MPYIASIQDKAYRVDTGETTAEREITLDGVLHKIDWRAIGPLAADAKGQLGAGGRFSLLIAGQSFEVFARRIVKSDEEGSQTYEIAFDGQRFEVQVEDEREKMLTGSIKSAHDTGEAKIRAPMPGLVIGVPVEVGSNVERGQTVIVLEAMKMENDLAAPKAGVLKEIKASKGQTVNQGDVLVIISSE